MNGNHFLKTDLILASENSFSSQWKQTIFFHYLRYFSRSSLSRLVETHFSVQKKKSVFYLELFFPANGNHYLNYREAYLKLLSLLLATIFFNFSDISANVISFFVQLKRILKQILHSCQWKPITCLLETVFFCLDVFFLLVEIQFLKFLLVETDFLVTGNYFFFFHFQTLLPLIASFFRLIETYL